MGDPVTRNSLIQFVLRLQSPCQGCVRIVASFPVCLARKHSVVGRSCKIRVPDGVRVGLEALRANMGTFGDTWLMQVFGWILMKLMNLDLASMQSALSTAAPMGSAKALGRGFLAWRSWRMSTSSGLHPAPYSITLSFHTPETCPFRVPVFEQW